MNQLAIDAHEPVALLSQRPVRQRQRLPVFRDRRDLVVGVVDRRHRSFCKQRVQRCLQRRSRLYRAARAARAPHIPCPRNIGWHNRRQEQSESILIPIDEPCVFRLLRIIRAAEIANQPVSCIVIQVCRARKKRYRGLRASPERRRIRRPIRCWITRPEDKDRLAVAALSSFSSIRTIPMKTS